MDPDFAYDAYMDEVVEDFYADKELGKKALALGKPLTECQSLALAGNFRGYRRAHYLEEEELRNHALDLEVAEMLNMV